MFSASHSGSFGSHGFDDDEFNFVDDIREREYQWALVDPLGAHKTTQARFKETQLGDIFKNAKNHAEKVKKNHTDPMRKAIQIAESIQPKPWWPSDSEKARAASLAANRERLEQQAAIINEGPHRAMKDAGREFGKAYNELRHAANRHEYTAKYAIQKQRNEMAAAEEQVRRNAPAASQKAYKLRDELQAAAKRRKEADEYVDELGLSPVNKEELKSRIMVILQARDADRDERIKGLGTKNAGAVSDAIYTAYFDEIVKILPPPIHRGGSRKRSARSKRTAHHKRKTYRRKTHRR